MCAPAYAPTPGPEYTLSMCPTSVDPLCGWPSHDRWLTCDQSFACDQWLACALMLPTSIQPLCGWRNTCSAARAGGAGDWDGEDFERVAAELEVDGTPEPLPTHVLVDAHIMCTPSLGDVDADGRDDLVIAVTYSFDRTYYDDPAHAGELARGIDSAMYLATGIVVFDMVLHTVKWSAQLDLSTDHVDYRCAAGSRSRLLDGDSGMCRALTVTAPAVVWSC